MQDIINLKKKILIAASKAKEGHIPSAFSVLDILYVLYNKFIDIEKLKAGSSDRDRFILSKGHASLALYAILLYKGLLDEDSFDTFGSFNSKLGGHPDTNKILGVEASTGSLGHGFPMAVGMSLGYKIKNIKNRVFALIGDGECNEGTIWESVLIASHHKLNNLTCIVDYNHSTDRALQIGNLSEKFNSFGWKSMNINGHNHDEIFNALGSVDSDKPLVIIAQTIKGYGCKPMENEPAWHHKSPLAEELSMLLDQTY